MLFRSFEFNFNFSTWNSMNRANFFKNYLLFYLICLSPWANGLGEGLMDMIAEHTATVQG